MERLITSKADVQALIHSQFFLQLMTLIEQKPPTLREIKAQLGEKSEKLLNPLIKHGLIIRENRRYYSGIQVVVPDGELLKKWVPEILHVMGEMTRGQQLSLLEQLLYETPVIAVYRLPSEVPVAFRQSVSNGELTITSVSLNQQNATLPNYFKQLDEQTEAYRLLGDVNIPYYLDQVQVVLEKISAHRRRIRPSIFVESMKLFQLIDDEFQLLVPMIQQPINVSMMSEFQKIAPIQQQLILGAVMDALSLSDETLVQLCVRQ